ncbi:MAG TPA: tetratricopeptide repeat protein [Parvularculaceae bacterium]|nr:hypothetical protein [Caulobacterales bacterium]HPE32244.1 tetratricopeptide repeat protein [Parvularculaceae bacterium]
MADRTFRPARSLGKYAGASICAILLASCASTGGGGKANVAGGDDYKDAIGAFSNPSADPSSLDPIAAAAFWGTRFDREPDNADVAVRYSAALRKIGSKDEAIKVMSKTATRHPDNADVNLEYGKTLVEDGRAFEAVRYLEMAAGEKHNDWRALSAYGVALDQIGEHDSARQKYDAALAMSPDAVSVMNNKGLSYVLSGDLKNAEATLRTAATSRRGDARVRQNLALVLAIKGDMREAERLARSDLPPQVADENIDYYRSLLSQPAYWQEYASDKVDAPNFDPAPAPAAKPDAAPAPAPLPRLKEEPKKEEKKDNSPIAQSAPAPLTNASAVVETKSWGEATDEKSHEIEGAPEIKK